MHRDSVWILSIERLEEAIFVALVLKLISSVVKAAFDHHFSLALVLDSLSGAFHLHSEGEDAALAHPIRHYLDLAVGRLDDFLDDREPEPDAFTVDRGGALQFPETSEQLVYIIGRDSDSRVFNVHDQGIYMLMVARLHLYLPLARKLGRVLDQVDQHLL